MSAAKNQIEEAKVLIAELCANLYKQGHVSGTGGGISIKVGDSIVMAPSGVQKERMRAEDMFVLDAQGNIVHTPEARPPPYKPPKLSECSPLFMSAYELRNAGAVLHGHSMNAFLATLLDPHASEFRITHVEMIKGISGQGFYSNMVVPIIENTARECELTDRLREAMEKYPESNAVLVRRHGVYVWGDTWIHAKTQFECYDYLFEAAVKMHHMGLNPAKAPAPPPLSNGAIITNGTAVQHAAKRARIDGGKAPTHVVLDIEGTVCSILFVSDVLFPYARQRVEEHLRQTWDTPSTQAAVDLLIWEAEVDGYVKPDTIDTAKKYCLHLMDQDRKSTGLKQLQGAIWEKGFAAGELRAELYRDVPDALATWRADGVKTYIYSSGSRQAQKDLFSCTTVGDLRPYLCGFFDTTSGAKTDSPSYDNIALSLGADSPGDILFATDNILEARAASKAGWRVVVADRPGNKPLPEDCEFKVVQSMTELF